MVKITFGDLDSARQQRNRPQIRGFLKDTDSGREKTLRLKENTPIEVLQELRGEAADSRAEEAEKYGQVELTDEERDRIDFSQTNVLAARSAKAIAVGKGVDDFTSYFDATLTVDEHRQVFEEAKQDERGQRGGRGLDDDREIQRRMARAHNQVKSEQLPRAKNAAFTGDSEAQSFVREQVGGPGGFDIGFTSRKGSLRGSGEDFERLLDRHEERSERAQALDERKTAPVTRDPLAWVNAPDRLDFPGIDTVDPANLHDQRSERAQETDEDELAPITRDRQKWAMNPDEFDFPGVDTPEGWNARF